MYSPLYSLTSRNVFKGTNGEESAIEETTISEKGSLISDDDTCVHLYELNRKVHISFEKPKGPASLNEH